MPPQPPKPLSPILLLLPLTFLPKFLFYNPKKYPWWPLSQTTTLYLYTTLWLAACVLSRRRLADPPWGMLLVVGTGVTWSCCMGVDVWMEGGFGRGLVGAVGYVVLAAGLGVYVAMSENERNEDGDRVGDGKV
ncbi:hypothetical protein Q7P36_008745 [Cladosporium allicinum]